MDEEGQAMHVRMAVGAGWKILILTVSGLLLHVGCSLLWLVLLLSANGAATAADAVTSAAASATGAGHAPARSHYHLCHTSCGKVGTAAVLAPSTA